MSANWYIKNRLRAVKNHKRWVENNRERSNLIKARWKKRNLNKARQIAKLWARKNRKKQVDRARERYQIEPAFRIMSVQRVRIRRALQGRLKAKKTKALVGCSPNEFKEHIERLFVPGMTWNNYGIVWQIDHKRPCCSFNLQNPEEQMKCFHFSNLQPLFSVDNRIKGGRYL